MTTDDKKEADVRMLSLANSTNIDLPMDCDTHLLCSEEDEDFITSLRSLSDRISKLSDSISSNIGGSDDRSVLLMDLHMHSNWW